MKISTYLWRGGLAVLALRLLVVSALAAPLPGAPAASLAPAPVDSAARPPHRARRADYTVAPGLTWHYEQPGQLRWLTHIPRDLGRFPGYFRADNVPAFVGIAAGSAALWATDEPILRAAQHLGRTLYLDATSTQKTLVYIPMRLGKSKVPLEFNVPDNLNSTFYFLGDGWTHLTIASSFMAYGWIKHDNRAAQTATQLGEAILSTGLVVQTLKRVTGRQSPFRATRKRGEWDLLPAYTTYQGNVSNFDAFPTGHLATAMATVTVIAENYPEYHFIRPVGYSLMGLLGYAMLNNGVHWASDYPLGIALGYGFAKLAVRHGRTRGLAPPAEGVGWQPLPRPRPWYRRGELAPFSYGPFTGGSLTWQL